MSVWSTLAGLKALLFGLPIPVTAALGYASERRVPELKVHTHHGTHVRCLRRALSRASSAAVRVWNRRGTAGIEHRLFGRAIRLLDSGGRDRTLALQLAYRGPLVSISCYKLSPAMWSYLGCDIGNNVLTGRLTSANALRAPTSMPGTTDDQTSGSPNAAAFFRLPRAVPEATAAGVRGR